MLCHVPTIARRLAGLGWEPYAWLVYSLPFLIAAFNTALRAFETWAMVGAYVLFLAIYLSGHWTRGPRILLHVAVLDAIAVVFGARNPPAACFFIYGSALVGDALPPRQAAVAVAVQVAAAALSFALLDLTVWFLIPATVISALVGAVTIQAAVNRMRNAKLAMAQAEVERLAKLAERERIARDLHDLLGHTLSVIVLKSELAQKLLARDVALARQEVAEVERIARDGLAEVREAITGYRSSGLHAELDHVRQALVAAGIDATIEARTVALAPAQETALSLALREAATNVIRHAGATTCSIRFYAQDGSVSMEVEDNGRGGDAPFGNGLTGMRERIQALGGALTRDTDRGTRLHITMPAAPPASL
jgi:two-component system, NarL family, sensor histidine kinase DesK